MILQKELMKNQGNTNASVDDDKKFRKIRNNLALKG